MDIELSDVKMLPSGDFEKLDKREKEAFHALQEEMIALLVNKSNHFKLQYPGLRIEWRFQAEVYQSIVNGPSSVRYSDRVY
ncbi:MAG TPA: hypothetical protein VF974_06050 [Patescibacteria group bacterium]